MPLDLVKSHAYGNDFLLVPGDQVRDRDPAELARALCDRQTGVGADGVILFRPVSGGAEMRLLNADGSRAEVSGNGVRCLAAWLLESGLVEERASSPVVIRTEAGEKRLWPLGRDGRRRAFRAEMGQPTDLAEPGGDKPHDAALGFALGRISDHPAQHLPKLFTDVHCWIERGEIGHVCLGDSKVSPVLRGNSITVGDTIAGTGGA